MPSADIRFVESGHIALETHGAAMREFRLRQGEDLVERPGLLVPDLPGQFELPRLGIDGLDVVDAAEGIEAAAS